MHAQQMQNAHEYVQHIEHSAETEVNQLRGRAQTFENPARTEAQMRSQSQHEVQKYMAESRDLNNDMSACRS